MNSIGSDMLRFMELNVQLGSIERVLESLDEIVKLLEPDSLVVFWRFCERLFMNSNYSCVDMYKCLSESQLRTVLTCSELPMTLERRNSFVGTPTARSTDTMGWMMLTSALYQYLSSLYDQSTGKGDQYLSNNVDVLSREFPSHLPIDFKNPSKDFLVPLARLSMYLSTQGFMNVLKSKGITDRMGAVRSCVVCWSLYPELSEKGKLLFSIVKQADWSDTLNWLYTWAEDCPIPQVTNFLNSTK